MKHYKMISAVSVLKKVSIILFVTLLALQPICAFAQTGVDCDDQNNPFDTPCPLDTWVIVLVIVAGLFSFIHLSRKQKIGRA